MHSFRIAGGTRFFETDRHKPTVWACPASAPPQAEAKQDLQCRLSFSCLRRRRNTKRQTERIPIEGPPSQECLGSSLFGDKQLARTPSEPTGSKGNQVRELARTPSESTGSQGNQVRGGVVRCITPHQTWNSSFCDSSSTCLRDPIVNAIRRRKTRPYIY